MHILKKRVNPANMGVAASRQEAFWEACGFGHKDRVRRFIEAGDIDVNWVSHTHDCCPIHVASQGKREIVQMLLDANCNVNVKDIRGNLPLHHAAMKGHADIIQMLIDAGSEVNTQDKNGWTPLHCAAYWSHTKAIKTLLKNGADVNIQNKDERTALHETARSQERNDFDLGEIAHSLIKAGSDVNAKSSDLGEADFTGLMFAAYHNHPEVATAFIDGGCEVDAHGTNFWTALHWATDRGNDEMVFLLLEAGADPTKKGFRGERASDRAKSTEIKEILLNAVNMFEELALLDGKQKQKSLTDIQSNLSKPKSFDSKMERKDICLEKAAIADPEKPKVNAPGCKEDNKTLTEKETPDSKDDNNIFTDKEVPKNKDSVDVIALPCTEDVSVCVNEDQGLENMESDNSRDGCQGDCNNRNMNETKTENNESIETGSDFKHLEQTDNVDDKSETEISVAIDDKAVSDQCLSVEEEKDMCSEKDLLETETVNEDLSKT